MVDIIANTKTLEYLSEITRSGNIPHAFVIEGSAGSGKCTIATHFAAMINCHAKEKPCGMCPSCKKIYEKLHVDIVTISKPDDKKTISVDTIRNVISDASLMPSEADKRVFIIKDGDTLTIQAQNAFLKMFEEPPINVVFIILTVDKKLLLQTILSRAVVLKTELLNDKTIEHELDKRTKKKAEEKAAAISICGGSLGRAIELLSGNKVLKYRKTVEEYMSLLKGRTGVFDLCEKFSPASFKRDDLLLIFPFCRLAFRDIATYKSGGNFSPMFFSDIEMIDEISKNISQQNAILLYEKADALCSALKSNVNPYTALSTFNAYVAEYARLG